MPLRLGRFNPRASCGARRPADRPRIRQGGFNPRAPCGARHHVADRIRPAVEFQSTRPVRGATRQRRLRKLRVEFQSTRPVRGATPHDPRVQRVLHVSIHAPRAGRDESRHSNFHLHNVSIHAPRAGRDSDSLINRPAALSFNPRAPCGARHGSYGLRPYVCMFQSTRPVRGATIDGHRRIIPTPFQSTRPVRGATTQYLISMNTGRFQSTRPVRGATAALEVLRSQKEVSIHAPRAGRDSMP